MTIEQLRERAEFARHSGSAQMDAETAEAVLALLDAVNVGALMDALKGVGSVMPDCEGDFLTDAKGNYIAKVPGIGTACRDVRAAIKRLADVA